MKVDIVLKGSLRDSRIILELPEEMYRGPLLKLLKLCGEKYNNYMLCSFSPPRRSRTLSQNAKFHAMLKEYALYMGTGIEDAKDGVKYRAMDERGYPSKELKLKSGRSVRVPKPSSEANTEEMGLLIEELIQTAAEDGYVFQQ